MQLFGTIFDGQIRLDSPANLPDGTRIVSLPADEYEVFGDLGDLSEFEFPHPMAPYDSVREAALLRERVAAVRAGGETFPLAEVMAEIRREIETMPARDESSYAILIADAVPLARRASG